MESLWYQYTLILLEASKCLDLYCIYVLKNFNKKLGFRAPHLFKIRRSILGSDGMMTNGLTAD